MQSREYRSLPGSQQMQQRDPYFPVHNLYTQEVFIVISLTIAS